MFLAAKLAFVLSGMAIIPEGTYAPLYALKGAERAEVLQFALDREPVTRGEFLEFVRSHPGWRKSRVNSAGYLADWHGDLSAGQAAELKRPVTSVSRVAAAAYCESRGKRLPTASEWEYAASASETRRDATRDRGFISRLIGYYGQRSGSEVRPIGTSAANIYGVRDMHELVWELTQDPMNVQHSHHDMSCAGAAMGATDPSNYAAFMRYAVRSGITDRTTMKTLGFRCAGTI